MPSTHREEVVRTLGKLGINYEDAIALRRISMTLHRWHELECGCEHGAIERDEKTGVPYWYNPNARYIDPHDPRARQAIPDREEGAKRRLAAIMKRYPTLAAYVQGDPRGCALYICTPEDARADQYSRGVAVYR